MICTFFGHSHCPDSIKPILKEKLIELIVEKGLNKFYVGNHGYFDYIVRTTLSELKKEYPQIEYYVVLAYLENRKDDYRDYYNTILPEGIENVPYRYAICYRNEWMIKQADFVIAYVRHPSGGAAKYRDIAEHRKKVVIDL